MRSLKFNEVKQVWAEISKYDSEISLPSNFELDLYKKLFDRFHPGSYYYYIFNTITGNVEFVSAEMCKLTGYAEKDFNADLIMLNLHPEDDKRFIDYNLKITEFYRELPPRKVLNYKTSFDYRLKCSDGSYKWILQQLSAIQCSDTGSIQRILGVHTDISFLKTDTTPSGLSFIGLDGEPSFYNVLVPSNLPGIDSPLSKREKEIANLILSGRTTEEIANILKLSPHTVKTHRKNIFRKTECKTLVELGAKIIKKRWV